MTERPPEIALADLLDGPMDDVSRIVVRHERRRRFRWRFLLDLVLLTVVLLCVVPLLLAAAVLSDGPGPDGRFDLPDLWPSMFHYWPELVVERRGAGGAVLAVARVRPVDHDDRDTVLRSILAAAHAGSVVVVETLGEPMEHLATWWGGQPLLASPERRPRGDALRILSERAQVTDGVQTVEIRLADPPGSWWLALFLTPIAAPVLIWTTAGRERLSALFSDLSGAAAPETVYAMGPDGLSIARSRAGAEEIVDRIDATELVGIAWMARLGFDRQARRLPPKLHVITPARTVRLSVPEAIGPALAELLVDAALAARGRAASPASAHCPHCARIYAFERGARCPACGAPPTITAGGGGALASAV